jgi:sugar porter (SP) family MFS transporter
MRRGRIKAALAALTRLRQSSELEIQKEMQAIEVSLGVIKQQSTTFRDLFTKPLRILVIVAAGLFFFQQFTGVNTLFYYAPLIFQSAGFKGINGAFIAAIIVTGINVLATFFGMWFVDSLGRRKLLLYGLLGIVLCMFTMGAAYHDWFVHKNIIVLISALLFIACFAISISGICYIIMSEIFPLNVRSKGMAIASCANWGFNWLVASTFLTLVNVTGLGNVYWFYASCSLVGFIFVFFLVPETKNHTLEEITKNLYEGVPVRHLGNPSLAKKYHQQREK